MSVRLWGIGFTAASLCTLFHVIEPGYEVAMDVDGKHMRTIWVAPDGWSVEIIDQTLLPHRFATRRIVSCAEMAHAIKAMLVRGAPLIGAAAAYGVALAMREDASDENLRRACDMLAATRLTAINLRWALAEMTTALARVPVSERAVAAYRRAAEIADEDVAINTA